MTSLVMCDGDDVCSWCAAAMCADPTDPLGEAGAAPDHLVRAAREAEAAGCAAATAAWSLFDIAASGVSWALEAERRDRDSWSLVLASHFDRAIQMVVAQADLPGHTDHLPEPVPALLVAEPATDQIVP